MSVIIIWQHFLAWVLSQNLIVQRALRQQFSGCQCLSQPEIIKHWNLFDSKTKSVLQEWQDIFLSKQIGAAASAGVLEAHCVCTDPDQQVLKVLSALKFLNMLCKVSSSEFFSGLLRYPNWSMRSIGSKPRAPDCYWTPLCGALALLLCKLVPNWSALPPIFLIWHVSPREWLFLLGRDAGSYSVVLQSCALLPLFQGALETVLSQLVQQEIDSGQ